MIRLLLLLFLLSHARADQGESNTPAERPTSRTQTVVPWREDGRCGPEFPTAGGLPGQCDPQGRGLQVGPCCSYWGRCGNSDKHCTCDRCIDYSKTTIVYGCSITNQKKVYYYSGSVISTGRASTVEDCALKCSVTPECNSYNFLGKNFLCTLRKGGTKLSNADEYSCGFCPKGKRHTEVSISLDGSTDVKRGDSAYLKCKADGKILTRLFCSFISPKPSDGSATVYEVDSAKECGIKIAKTEDKHNGQWKCEIIGTDSKGEPVRGTAEMSLTVEIPPSSVRILAGKDGNQTELILSQGREEKVTCLAEEGRPDPSLSWHLDGNAMGGGQLTKGQGHVRSVLTYTGQFKDLGKNITCTATHPGYSKEEIMASLNVAEIKIIINPDFIPLNKNEILVSFVEIFSDIPKDKLVKATVQDSMGKILGKSSLRSLDLLKKLVVKAQFNPCKSKAGLKITVKYTNDNGGEATVTKGPFSYTPDEEDCPDGHLVEEATMSDALAGLAIKKRMRMANQKDSENNVVPTGPRTSEIILVASLGCLALSIAIIGICLCCQRMENKRQTGRITKVEENSEYHVYYSATGERLTTKQEVTDRNPEYEATPQAEKEIMRRKNSEENDYDEMYEAEKNYENLKT